MHERREIMKEDEVGCRGCRARVTLSSTEERLSCVLISLEAPSHNPRILVLIRVHSGGSNIQKGD